VVVIGTVVRDELFGPDLDPVGQVIRVQNQPFTVIGVLAPKGQSGVGRIRTTWRSRTRRS
jgi:putative ABC transport system permease protein